MTPQGYDLTNGEIPPLEGIALKMMRRGMLKAARMLRDAVRAETPVRTGKLAASVRYKITKDGREAIISVGRRGRGKPWYAHLVLSGAKAHRIPKERRRETVYKLVGVRRPSMKRSYIYHEQLGYLRKYGGRVVFIKAFMHRGARPNLFTDRAAVRAMPQIEQSLVDTVGAVMAELRK